MVVKNKPNKELLYKLYVIDGLLAKDISEIYDCSLTTVKGWLIKDKHKPKLCACGCGNYVGIGAEFIKGHSGRKPKSEPQLCECGCGEYAKPGRRFIVGHNTRLMSDDTRDKIRESLIEYFDDPKIRAQMSEKTTKQWQNPEIRERLITAQLEGWKDPIAHENASKAQKKRYKDSSPQYLSEIGTYPELEGVDEDATFKQFGYYSTQLSEKSGRLIVRVCIKCGRTKNIQKCAYSSLCHKCVTQTEEFRKMRSEIATEQFSTEEGREKDRQGVIKRWKDPEEHIKASIANKKAQGTPEARKANSERSLQYHKDHPEQGIEHGIFLKQYYMDNPEERERRSATKQGQDYDAGEWTGFTDHGRPHLVPKNRCIHLNPWFDGCNQHHIMTGVIINMPGDLHRKIRHKISNDNKTHKNMKEINELAFKYLLGRS